MKSFTFTGLLRFALFFLGLWFFGNLYEEVLLVPNHIHDAYEKLTYWHRYFTHINQIVYYVPFTQLAVIVICILYFQTHDEEEKRLLKKAGLFGVGGVLLTVIIVTQLNFKLYIGDQLDEYKDQLQSLSVLWLMGNAIRLYCVGNALYYTFNTYVLHKIKNTTDERNSFVSGN